MKKIALFLCFSLGYIALFAQTNSYFTINIGTFVDTRSSEFQNLKPLGFVHAYSMENNLYQVFLGGFDTRAAAESAVAQVHAAGYAGAYVQERFLGEGQTATVVQIGAVEFNKPVDWSRYSPAGELYGIASPDKLKLVVGIFANLEEARKALPGIQKKGFKDAFIRSINTVYLQRIGVFESDNQVKPPLVDFKWENSKKPANQQAQTQTKPDSYDQPGIPSKPQTTPKTIETTVKSPGTTPPANVPPSYSDIPVQKTAEPARPTIRQNVKRRSALELQKILKAETYYTGSLDGYYGAGTGQAYDKAVQNNLELQKYRLLVQNMAVDGSTSSGDALQNAINRLPEDARAQMVLESYNIPVAKAYQAYQLFNQLGPGNEVNNLMNAAIREAYTGKNLKNAPPFDYRASYAYNDLDQLILHLFYIHVAPGVTYSIPCWLSKQHPRETARAQAALAGYASPAMQPCDPFSDWEEVRLLQAVANDIGAQRPSAAKTSEAAAARAMLYLANRPMSAQSQKEIDTWNTNLWANINNWANRDPFNQRLIPALRITYYQSAVRLEDFFMDKGFSSEESKYLALATLRTFVGPSLERFQ